MISTTASAPIAHAFDPAAWLAQFQSLGGGYSVTDTAAHVGVPLAGSRDDDFRAAKAMLDAIEGGEHLAVAEYLRARQGGLGHADA